MNKKPAGGTLRKKRLDKLAKWLVCHDPGAMTLVRMDISESLRREFPERYARAQKFERRADLWDSFHAKFIKEVNRRIETKLVQGETDAKI